MPTTVQDVLNYARLTVNDTASARYSDADGLTYANAAIAKTLDIRPDLRMGTSTSSGILTGYGWGAYTALVATSSFPLSYDYVEKIAHFVIASWQSKDDPFVNSGLQKQEEQAFTNGLLGP